jgi:hypothetical protein
LTSRPFVSAFAPNGVTVSGPPPSLAQLVRWKEAGIKENRLKMIPVYGPYHAPHLFSEADVNEIIHNLAAANDADLKLASETVSLLSGAGQTVKTRDFSSLLGAAMGQILL